MTNTTTAQAAEQYISLGWSPVPVPARLKRPVEPGWSNPGQVFSPDDFPAGGNIGLRLGRFSNGLADVDADCAEALTAAPAFLPATGMISGRESKPRSHYFYETSEPLLTIKLEDPVLLTFA